MSEITNERIYEALKAIHEQLGAIDRRLDEVKNEITAIRLHSLATLQDTQNIYTTLARQDGRLERIERRLDLAEPL